MSVISWLFVLQLQLIAGSSIRLELHRQEVPANRPTQWNRYRRLFDGTYELVLLNIGLGTHYTWIYAGTPPQRASVIVDTGSHLLAFPCAGCTNCGKHTDAPYDMSKSSTASYVSCRSHPPYSCLSCKANDQCILRQSYTEGSSWTAVLLKDIVWLGNDTFNNPVEMSKNFGTAMNFGCQTSETGLFTSQTANGIMGMADYAVTLVPHLHGAGKLKHKVFSLCFAKHGGSMVLGAPESFKHKEKATYAKLMQPTSKNKWYSVRVKDVKIGGTTIGVDPAVFMSGKKVIVDSGTTDSYLPSGVKTHFERVFKKVARASYPTAYSGSCHGFTSAQVQKLPSIQIIMEGEDVDDVILDIPATQYMEKASNGKYCGSIYLNEPSGGVIGANIMQDHDVIFDIERQLVGFAKADCAFPKPAPPTPTASKKGTPSPAPTITTKSPGNTTGAVPISQTPSPFAISPSPSNTATPTPEPPFTFESTDPVIEPPKKVTKPTNTTAPVLSSGNQKQPSTDAPFTFESTDPVVPKPNQSTPAPPTPAPPTPTPPTPAPPTPAPPTPAPPTPAPPTPAPPTPAPPTPTPPTPAPPTPMPPTMDTGTTPKNPLDHATQTVAPPVENPDKALDNGTDHDISKTEEQPLVLTIVGVVVASLFLIGVLMMCFRRRKRATRWTRLEEEDDSQDGLSLVGLATSDEPSNESDDSRPPTYRDTVDDSPIRFDEDLDDDDFFDTSDHQATHDPSVLEAL